MDKPPLEALSVCHARTRQRCADMRRMALELGERGSDAEVRQAGRELLDFFDTVVPRHHADEEEDLFPALLESMAGSDAVCIRELTSGLAAEHRELQSLWSALRPALQAAASGEGDSLPVQEVEMFVERCRLHDEREESELLPMAARLLTEDQVATIAAGMEARRPPRR